MPYASEFFTGARLKALREEIVTDGFVPDPFLSNNSDCPVFGVNLACAHPFPAQIADWYARLADDLAKLDNAAYVYPLWQTHITLVTFINFARHQVPNEKLLEHLNGQAQQVISELRDLFSDSRPFELHIERPLISPKAAILPMSDPSGAVARIRSQVESRLKTNPALLASLQSRGLNIPQIIHATIMRFKSIPRDTSQFLATFDQISASVAPMVLRINELLLTSETKPYMRDGEVVHRSLLKPA